MKLTCRNLDPNGPEPITRVLSVGANKAIIERLLAEGAEEASLDPVAGSDVRAIVRRGDMLRSVIVQRDTLETPSGVDQLAAWAQEGWG